MTGTTYISAGGGIKTQSLNNLRHMLSPSQRLKEHLKFKKPFSPSSVEPQLPRFVFLTWPPFFNLCLDFFPPQLRHLHSQVSFFLLLFRRNRKLKWFSRQLFWIELFLVGSAEKKRVAESTTSFAMKAEELEINLGIPEVERASMLRKRAVKSEHESNLRKV